MINSKNNKQKILEAFLKNCLLNGWNDENLKNSAREVGFSEMDLDLFFKNGVYSLIDFFIDEGNKELEEKAKEIDLKSLKIRDKIKELVKLRLLIEAENKKALRVLITISKGVIITKLLKSSYKISDKIWQIAGDKSNSSDFNFYSKRFILSKVFSKTLRCFISDNSVNNKKSWDLLDNEIEKVMRIGKIKMQIQTCTNKLKECTFSNSFMKENFKKLPFIRLFHHNK